MILDDVGIFSASFRESEKMNDNWSIWSIKIVILMIILNTFPRHNWQEPKEVSGYINDTLLHHVENQHPHQRLIWDCECDKIVNSPNYNYNRICDQRKTVLAVIVFLYK